MLKTALTEVPPQYLCPITYEVMKEPVVCADGHTYERSAIEEWLRAGKLTSPVTGKRLPSVTTVTNFALRSSIEEFVAQRDAIETRNKSADDHDRARGGVLDQLRQRQQQQQGEKRWEQPRQSLTFRAPASSTCRPAPGSSRASEKSCWAAP